MDDPTYTPDPRLVREIARDAINRASRRRDDIDSAINSRREELGQLLAGGDRQAYGALWGAVRNEMRSAAVTVTWPDDRGFAWHDLTSSLDEGFPEYQIGHPDQCRALPPGACCWADREPFRWWWPTEPGDYRIRPESLASGGEDSIDWDVQLRVQARDEDGGWVDYEGDTAGAEPADDETPAIVERIKVLTAEKAARDAVHEALLIGVEVVLLDHTYEIYGPLVDPNIAELAYRFLAVVGDEAPVEIRNAVAVNAAEGSWSDGAAGDA